MLSAEELKRYSRQLIVTGWGIKEQLILKQLRVAIPSSLPSAALYLSAAGVSEIILYGTDPQSENDLGQNFKEHLKAFNPFTVVTEIGALGPNDKKSVDILIVDNYANNSPAPGNISYNQHINVPTLSNHLLTGALAANTILHWCKNPV